MPPGQCSSAPIVSVTRGLPGKAGLVSGSVPGFGIHPSPRNVAVAAGWLDATWQKARGGRCALSRCPCCQWPTGLITRAAQMKPDPASCCPWALTESTGHSRIADVECLHGHAAIRMATRALRASADDRGGLHFSVVMRSRSAPIANSGAVETTADGLGGRTCKPDSGARTLSFDRAPAGLPG
jgi:hypothetical protein